MKQSIFEASEALQKWEGMILKKTRSFSSNSEVEATWFCLIGWPHKTSSKYVLMVFIYIVCFDFSIWNVSNIIRILQKLQSEFSKFWRSENIFFNYSVSWNYAMLNVTSKRQFPIVCAQRIILKVVTRIVEHKKSY